PPSPPNPSADEGVIPRIHTPDTSAPSPPIIVEDGWDISEVRPETAMKLLCRCVQTLANITGNVPPTPPLSRPTTPKTVQSLITSDGDDRLRSSSRPATPVPSDDLAAPTFVRVDVGSPEASMHEASTVADDVGAYAEPVHIQQEAIARKFFSKKIPPISLEEYLMRLQRYCPMSTAVYLAAAVYIYKLSVEEKLVPITQRTVHRLVLAALRVAMKALEDLRYPQRRFAGVGGVQEKELKGLEISICYLLDFDLQVNSEMLWKKTMMLQQAAQQSSAVRTRLPTSFQPRLP
ncbi:cyclin-domain-containing protein, partial [Aulographum hederae CBS 113979]